MTKQEFLAELREKLTGLPEQDLEERLSFYSESIDDRMEDGLPEEEAVADVGAVEEIVAQITEETPLTKLVVEKIRPKKKRSVGTILLLVLGSPLWVPLLIAALAVAFSLYVVGWSVLISFWSVDLSLAAGSLGCLAGTVMYFGKGNPGAAIFSFGGALLCAGLAVLAFFGCLWLSKQYIRFTKKLLTWIKSLFIGKGKEEI